MSLDLKLKKVLIYGAFAVSFCAASVIMGKRMDNILENSNRQTQITEEYNRTYRFALLKYADTNRDSLVSSAEQDEFDRKLLKDKGVTLIPNTFPRYITNGQEVPQEILTRWIREYKE